MFSDGKRLTSFWKPGCLRSPSPAAPTPLFHGRRWKFCRFFSMPFVFCLFLFEPCLTQQGLAGEVCSGQPAAPHLWQGTGAVSRVLPAAWHLRTQQVTVTDRHQQRDYFTAPCWQQPCGCKGSFCASSPSDTEAAWKSAAHFGNLPDSYNFISRGTYSCIKP